VEFSDGTDRGADLLLQAAKDFSAPVKHVKLEGEDCAYSVWGARLVLLRPDGHVSWRGDLVIATSSAKKIIGTIIGAEEAPIKAAANSEKKPEAFTSTVGMNTQDSNFEFEKIGEMQR